jgi:MYXO-CTERM domain-containing protein
MSLRRGWLVTLLLIGMAVLAPVALRAQTDTTTITRTTQTEDEDHDFPWGLLGLLGLAGLIPRGRKDVHVHDVHTHPGTVPPREDRITPNPPPPPRV